MTTVTESQPAAQSEPILEKLFLADAFRESSQLDLRLKGQMIRAGLVFIDAENISARLAKQIQQTDRSTFEQVDFLAFGNFRSDNLKLWTSLADNPGINLIQCDRLGSNRKNVTDTTLVTHLLSQSLRHPTAAASALATDDIDFLPAVRELRRLGHSIHGYGTVATPKELCGAYSHFTYLMKANYMQR